VGEPPRRLTRLLHHAVTWNPALVAGFFARILQDVSMITRVARGMPPAKHADCD